MASSSSRQNDWEDKRICTRVIEKLGTMGIPVTQEIVEKHLTRHKKSIQEEIMTEPEDCPVEKHAVERLTAYVAETLASAGDLSGEPYMATTSHTLSKTAYYDAELLALVEDIRLNCLTEHGFDEDVDREIERRVELARAVWDARKPSLEKRQDVLPEFADWIPRTRESVITILGLDNWQERWDCVQTLRRERSNLETTLGDAEFAHKVDQDLKSKEDRFEKTSLRNGKPIRKKRKVEATVNRHPTAGPSRSLPDPFPSNEWIRGPNRLERKPPVLSRHDEEKSGRTLRLVPSSVPSPSMLMDLSGAASSVGGENERDIAGGIWFERMLSSQSTKNPTRPVVQDSEATVDDEGPSQPPPPPPPPAKEECSGYLNAKETVTCSGPCPNEIFPSCELPLPLMMPEVSYPPRHDMTIDADMYSAARLVYEWTLKVPDSESNVRLE